MKSLLLLVLFGIGFLIGCSRRETVVKTEEWWSQGDPIELIRGMNMNKGTNGIPEDFSLEAMVPNEETVFLNKSRFKKYEEIVKEQDSSNRNMISGLLAKDSKGETLGEEFKSIEFKTKTKNTYKLYFLIQDNLISLYKIYLNGQRLPFNFENTHLSIQSDGKAMSVLFYWKDSGFVRLVNLFFSRSLVVPVDKLNEKFYYLTGAGKGVRWKKKIDLNLCGVESRIIHDALLKAGDIWNSELKENAVVQVASKPEKLCPPFSDLNFHGTYYVKNFNTTPSVSDYSNPALVLSHISGEILDSDLMVLDRELKKNYKIEEYESFEDYLNETTVGSQDEKDYFNITYLRLNIVKLFVHELGHVLGLGHNFTGEDSVMSYKNQPQGISFLSDYDKMAIQELYRK